MTTRRRAINECVESHLMLDVVGASRDMLNLRC